MFEIFIVVIILIVALPIGVMFFAFISSSASSDRRKKFKEKLINDYNAEVHQSHYHDVSLGVSVDTQKLYVGNDEQLLELDFSQLISVDLKYNFAKVEESKGETRTNRGSQIVGATIGGLVLGPAGAVVGGLTGSRRHSQRSVTSEELTSITLTINTRDPKYPSVRFAFGRAEPHEAENCLSALTKIIENSAKHLTVEGSTTESLERLEILERLWKMKESGALSADEYEQEKRRI